MLNHLRWVSAFSACFFFTDDCTNMMPRIPLALLTAVALAACGPSGADANVAQDASTTTPDAAASSTTLELPPAGSVRHIVVFKFRDGTTQAEIDQLTEAFRELQHTIPGILGFEHGQNHSPEGKDQDFDHVYTITFESVEARDVYLPHPEHVAFGQILGELGIVEDAFVVDYDPQG